MLDFSPTRFVAENVICELRVPLREKQENEEINGTGKRHVRRTLSASITDPSTKAMKTW